MFWLIHRAEVQSITIDEANSFRVFAQAGHYSIWQPLSNNHVLNSILMRLLNWLFGISQFTARGPALFGGFVYIAASYSLCVSLTGQWMLRAPLFIGFIYNPFVMDYLVVARGYGLALGFFTLAIALAVRTLLRLDEAGDWELIWVTAGISACLGISFCANYSFAFANAALLCVFYARVSLRVAGWRGRLRLAFAATAPAVVLTMCIAGPMLLRFPRKELYWGTNSLIETWQYIYSASFNQTPRSYYLLTLGALILVAYTLSLVRDRSRSCVSSRVGVAAIAACVLGLSLLMHWFQFKLFAVPLPLDRTSLWVMPLLMTFVGSLLSAPPASSVQRMIRGLGLIVLGLCGILFIASLRDSYFQEWRLYGADVKSAFPVLIELSRKMGVREIPADWKDVPSLNFYRDLYGVTDLPPFQQYDKIPSGRKLYALPRKEYQEFIHTEGLHAVYQGPISNLEILVK